MVGSDANQAQPPQQQPQARSATIKTDGLHIHLDIGSMSPLEICEACRRILDRLIEEKVEK